MFFIASGGWNQRLASSNYIVGQIVTKIVYYSVLNNMLDEAIVYAEQRFKTKREFRFVELLNPKSFHGYEWNFSIELFSTLDVYKNILNLDEFKWKMKSVYDSDFEKQASISRRDNMGTWTKPSSNRNKQMTTSDSNIPHLLRVNNYMRCF